MYGTEYNLAHSNKILLPEESWVRLSQINYYLKKFQLVSVKMCGDMYPTLSMAVPFYNSLLTHIEKFGELTRPAPDAVEVDILHNAVIASYGKIVDYYNITSDYYTIATVLDPRVKLMIYEEGIQRENVFRMVNNTFKTDYFHEPILSIIEPDDQDDLVFISTATNVDNEFERYISNVS